MTDSETKGDSSLALRRDRAGRVKRSAAQRADTLAAFDRSVRLSGIGGTLRADADEASADLLTQRIQLHEKTAWMLRSLLEE